MATKTIAWSPEFSIGHDQTDAQHQQLFKLLGLIQKAAASEIDRNKLIEKSLTTLIEYTQVHFRDEEAMMQRIGYPLLEQHRALHDALIDEVEGMLEDFQEGEYLLIDELILFLTDWLSEHILTVDAKVGVFIQDQAMNQ